jgi:prophage regulatory protein
MKTDTKPPINSLMRLPAVLAAVGLGRSTLYGLIAAGGFPPPIRLTPSGRAVAWPSSVVEAWIGQRLNQERSVK